MRDAHALIQQKGDFEADLSFGNFAILDLASNLTHLEPFKLVDRCRGFFNRVVEGAIDTFHPRGPWSRLVSTTRLREEIADEWQS